MVLHLPVNTAFFESRTKDNTDVPNFKARRKSFVYKSETELSLIYLSLKAYLVKQVAVTSVTT